ncbi:MAG: lipase family protein [Cyanobacteria bacterium P01_E01_bin.35]
MSKTIPSATIEELSPPNKNYQYFENFTKHPFKYKSEHFQMVNAWWLAESSLLAYAESDFAKEHFSAAGLTAELFSGKSTQCYVAHNDNFVIVAFRGTQVNDFRDIVRDVYINAKFNLVDSEQGGFVHQGFKEGLNEIWSNLLNHLNQLKTEKPERTFWFTGHSLGAALATLAADRYGSVQGLYTFGSPLVGDDAFSNDFSVNTYRFVNNNDFITLIPYRIPLPEISLFGISLPEIFRIRRYQHVGQLKYLDSNGHIIDNPNLWNRLVDSWKGQFGQLFHLSGQLREGWIKEIPVDNLTDHAPIYYAIHIWNNYKQDLTFN